MSHAHSTTKRRTFKHLNAYQRGQIEAMLRLGVPKVKIAKDLGIARSTLYEEIKRGTVTQKRSDWTYYEQYFAQSGQIRYERNRENSGKPSEFKDALINSATHLFCALIVSKGLLHETNVQQPQFYAKKHRSRCLKTPASGV